MQRTKQTRKPDDREALARCPWCLADPLYVRYHDEEWGFPTADDVRLFEKICLEGFQCGLSWLTILRKRENFREAFRGFDIERVARMTKRDVDRLLRNDGIVRHRGKIESAINNARRAIELADQHGTLAGFLWPHAPRRATGRTDAPRRLADLPATTAESTALSKSLRRARWSFVGPTTMYAFMQAVGMVNDHLAGCAIHARVVMAFSAFSRPRSPGATQG